MQELMEQGWDGGWLIKFWARRKPWVQSLGKLGVVAHGSNPSSHKAETG